MSIPHHLVATALESVVQATISRAEEAHVLVIRVEDEISIEGPYPGGFAATLAAVEAESLFDRALSDSSAEKPVITIAALRAPAL